MGAQASKERQLGGADDSVVAAWHIGKSWLLREIHMDTAPKVKEVWVHDIINAITVARGYAQLLAQQRSEVTEPVKRLEEDLMQAHKTFVDAVMPILRPEKDE
jgi:hypothetical protein